MNIPEETSLKALKIEDEGIQDLLEKMLNFNPYFRPSAKELLDHPFFDEVRCPDYEAHTPKRIQLEFDKDKHFDHEKPDFKFTLGELQAALHHSICHLQFELNKQ